MRSTALYPAALNSSYPVAGPSVLFESRFLLLTGAYMEAGHATDWKYVRYFPLDEPQYDGEADSRVRER